MRPRLIFRGRGQGRGQANLQIKSTTRWWTMTTYSLIFTDLYWLNFYYSLQMILNQSMNFNSFS